MKIPRSLQSAKYPSLIRDNPIIIHNTIPEKIFPSIGLKNSSSSFKLNNFINIEKELEVYLKQELYPLLVKISKSITQGYRSSDVWRLCGENIKDIIYQIKNNSPKLIVKNNKCYSIILSDGADLIQKLKNLRREYCNYVYGLDRLVDIDSAEFNDLRALQQDNIKISFSSSGNKGNWDIATMSMRGIYSCQEWSSRHAKALVGSLVDPYAGIIYLSQGELNNGSKMIRRAVVRYVINRETMKPTILIERIYPFDYESGMTSSLTLAAFTNFIYKKTKGKFEIQYGEFKGTRKYSIPLTEIVKKLNPREKSYRDSKIGYREFKNL